MKKLKKKIINLVLLFVLCIIGLCGYFLVPSTKADDSNNLNNQQQIVVSGINTGASAAPKEKKGGALYIERGSVYTMKGGSIRNQDNHYGGAVYVSKNATFTLDGGSIEGCRARYGGAIYVEDGGVCIINSGSITGNFSEFAPAIFVENGGTLKFSEEFLVENNEIKTYVHISRANDLVEVGTSGSGLSLRYIEFGSYPQTYVGSSMNATLEEWYASNSPTSIATYSSNYGNYYAYKYTDGSIYARGKSSLYASNYKYGNGETAVGATYTWFKVEPIKWIILNYEKYKSGEDNFLELMSYNVLTAGVRVASSNTDSDGVVGSSDDPNLWTTSKVRDWLNNAFYNSAFTSSEQAIIKRTLLGNNINIHAGKEISDTLGQKTIDKIYVPSWWELNGGSGTLNNNSVFTSKNIRIVAPTDYAISTGVFGEDVCYYWTRSVTDVATKVYIINNSGAVASSNLTSKAVGVRPVMRLAI